DARHVWHGHVDDRDIRTVGACQPDGLSTFSGFRDHLDVTLAVDHRADAGSHEVVVLDQHHLDRPALNLHGDPPVVIARRPRFPSAAPNGFPASHAGAWRAHAFRR